MTTRPKPGQVEWPKGPVSWIESRTLFVSIPFTWNLPRVRDLVAGPNLLWDRVRVGGPATQLRPDFFSDLAHVSVGGHQPGVLQRVNPLATRTTLGCVRRCGFCGIGQGMIEGGGFVELDDWPDLPVLVDNNLLAASGRHFDRVVDRLKVWGWADFTQGLDARLLTDHHASRLAEIGRPLVRLALDNMRHADAWEDAFARLRRAGLPLRSIRSYALIGFDSGPDEAWERCRWIEAHKIKASPMWFHPLDALQWNRVTPSQEAMGWTSGERIRIMQWFYQHLDREKRLKKSQTDMQPSCRLGQVAGWK